MLYLPDYPLQLHRALRRRTESVKPMGSVGLRLLARNVLVLTTAAVTLANSGGVKPPSMYDVLKATYDLGAVEYVSLTSDGARVAYWQSQTRLEGDTVVRHAQLYIQSVADGRRWAFGAGKNTVASPNEVEPQWSHNGKSLAFLSDASSRGQLQLYVADANGKSARRISNFKGSVDNIQWAPNDQSIAALYIPDARRQPGALAPASQDVGVVGSTIDEQRIVVVNTRTAEMQMITPPNYVYEFDWSPDAQSFVLTYAPGDGDDNWWIARLATFHIGERAFHDLMTSSYQIACPRWSPDGRRIAFIGGLMSDFGSTGRDVYTLNADGRHVRNVTKAIAISARELQWISPGAVAMAAHRGGSTQLVRLNVETGRLTALTPQGEFIRSWSANNDGSSIAFVRTSFDEPPELWFLSNRPPVRLTHANDHAMRLWGAAKSISWRSEGYNEQGWLIYPLSFDPEKTYPMITIVHGGPSAMNAPSYANRMIAALSSQGYFVFEPNFRGSYGFGESFTAANVKDFGYGDWRDILAGIDAVAASAPIDESRLGLYGWSYGGYMGMWAETHTSRFRAIVAGAGIADWQSYYGQNKIDKWMLLFFGASVYDDPGVYAKSSPVAFIKASHTPILLLGGDSDEEVPIAQSLEFWHAMKTLGVPTELVVYPGAGHGLQNPSNQIDMLQRVVTWFHHYLQ